MTVTASIVDGAVPRVLPRLTPENRPFWTGGAKGALLIQRCDACDRWVHPPTDVCPTCGGPLHPEAVSGRGTIFTFTVNVHQFHPDVPPPVVIAIVELVEQSDLRLPTNIVGAEVDELRCGLPVQVVFERNGEVYIPLFTPVDERA